MKTVYITAYHGFVSRALFQGALLPDLTRSGDVRVVICAPSAKKDYLTALYGGPHVQVAGVDVHEEVALPYNKFWYRLGFLLEDTHYVLDQRKERLWNNRTLLGYCNYALVSALALSLQKIPFGRDLYRYLDRLFTGSDIDTRLFPLGAPDLVFAGDVFGEADLFFLRAARRRKISTVGMIRSWDNTTTKGILRFFPDSIIVNSGVIQEELVRIHGFPIERTHIVGLPQFDAWVGGPTMSREDFLGSLGIPTNKRLLLFAPAGAVLSSTDWQLCSLLQRALDDGRLPSDTHILVRNHPAHPADLSRFQGDNRFTIEIPGSRIVDGDFKGAELTPKDDEHLRNSIYYSDMVMYIATSLGLDASVFNKPQIIVSFDGWEKKPYVQSVERYNQEDCLANIVRRKGMQVVRSEEEWLGAIQRYLVDPMADNEGRQKAIQDFLFSSDGKASARIAQVLLHHLTS